jgi:plasmid replication initiation protein
MNNYKNFILIKKQDNLRYDYQVVKENILNEAKLDPKMKALEYRLILIAMSKISPLSEELGFIYFTAKDFCELMELRKDGMYSYIKKTSQTLATRTLTIENKQCKKGLTLPWFAEIKYDESLIGMLFNKRLEKHILKIKKENGYTKYFIKNVLSLKSKYAMRAYELIKQCEKMGTKVFELEDFKEKIGAVKKAYNQMFVFRRDILKKLIDEINICTDMYINYEEIKEGRKVTHLKFLIKRKSNLSNIETVAKDKIILRIQNLIFKKTGYIFEAKHMNHIHRKILLELIEYFEKNKYISILIEKPENFFLNELKLILEKYDLNLLKKKYADY